MLAGRHEPEKARPRQRDARRRRPRTPPVPFLARDATCNLPGVVRTPGSAGTCFGYSIRSDIEFHLLRGGVGEPLTVVEHDGRDEPAGEPLLEWFPRPGHDFAARLYAHPDGGEVRFWIDDIGCFSIDPEARRIAAPSAADGARREARLWGLPTALCFITRRDLSIHAAAVEIEGRALLLGAPGGFGKTTLAAACHRSGHRLLSEDMSCCRPSDGTVLPGPALLRVRPDVYERIDLPGTHLLTQDAGRVYLALDPQRRCSADPVPLAAIVTLHLGDRIGVTPIPAAEILPDLWSLNFNLPFDSDRLRAFDGITALAAKVPGYRLERSLRFDNLEEVVDRLAGLAVART